VTNQHIISKEEEMRSAERVFGMTRDKVHAEGRSITRKPIRRFAHVSVAAVLVLVLSVGVVFADKIADQIKDFVTTKLSMGGGQSVEISGIGYITIADTVKAHKGPGFMPMKVNEVEAMLGINLLTSKAAATDDIGYDTLSVKGKIGRIDLWNADFIEYPNEVPEGSENYKSISASMCFLTQHADEGLWSPFSEGIDATGGKEVKQTYHINALDTAAVIYGVDWSDQRLSAAFVYENIFYTFIGNNLSEAEMIDVLENLE